MKKEQKTIINGEWGKNDVMLITTDEYIITFGQNNFDDYYPSNFFDIEECKKEVINNLKNSDEKIGSIIDLQQVY